MTPKPPPPDDFDESPELDDAWFASAVPFRTYWAMQARAMRQAASALRAQADELERRAEEMDADDHPHAAE